jgi:lactobin A/cerein 7B family class IIb bacteriocin
MNKLNLEAYGVSEMTDAEMRKTNGGGWWWIVGVIIGGLIYDIASNPTATAEAWNAGKERALQESR